MTQLGFAIDQRACIGCHACTVACKAENDVPLGAFRTWVKYIEKGEFPTTMRSFSVLRCNHCTDAPCISICPTNALFKRDNGIVDFDNARCIGCKSCMQACPYDALYIEPETNTAAKCNFCAHRVEVGLEPACVIVCPTHAIVSGDLDDPSSEIARLVASQSTHVRAPEQGTGPNVFYIEADGAAINPLATKQPDEYMWAERNLLDGKLQPRLDEADQRARTVYDVDHPMLWGWKVSAYLWTKSIAAGVMIVAATALLAGHARTTLLATVAPVLALAFSALTGVLLVADLKRPSRFLYIFTKSNFSSWLVRGAYVLAAYTGVLSLWIFARIIGNDAIVDALRWPALGLAVATAAYTGWLFGQAEGRDLWQSPALAPSLVAQAVLAGGATLAIASRLEQASGQTILLFARMTVAAAAAWAALTILELGSHTTQQARLASKNLTRGPYRNGFHVGVVAGMLAPIAAGTAFLLGGHPGLLVAGGVAAMAGLIAYEHAFVRAGQSIPLS